MPPVMSLETLDRGWLPLGNAKLIDWRFLNQDDVHQGAIAWADSIKGETVLARTWCEETITHLDFAWLAYPNRRGHLTIQVSRPEPKQLIVKLQLSLGTNQTVYREKLEFIEHPQTGLQGKASRSRDFEGDAPESSLGGSESLSAAQIEILEYAPESALHSECGPWFRTLVASVHNYYATRNGETTLTKSANSASASTTTPTRTGPPKQTLSSLSNGHVPHSPPTSEERPRAPSTAGSRSRLFVATSSGESWEIDDQETYIGRSKQCSVVLKSQRVSRKHASVTYESGQWFINDLGAANGVWAGSEKIERETIEDGAEYIVGDVLLTFTLA